MFHRFGHLKDIFVKEGDKVKKGDKIATIGNTGNSTFAHLHWDISGDYVGRSYVNGWKRSEVEDLYIKPAVIGGLPSENDHYGWEWLQWYGKGFHPGIDINGPGPGNSDLGQEVYAPEDGEIVEVYKRNTNNFGWGNLIIMKETMSEKCYHITSDLEKELQKRDKDFDGDKKSDQKEMAVILREERHRLEELESKVVYEGNCIVISK